MTKNPLLNALLAVAYIALVASIMFYGSRFAGPDKSVLIPIAILSLFVLSVATMATIFFYRPIRMYLDGQKDDAAQLFLHTLATFACITILLLTLLFLNGSHQVVSSVPSGV